MTQFDADEYRTLIRTIADTYDVLSTMDFSLAEEYYRNHSGRRNQSRGDFEIDLVESDETHLRFNIIDRYDHPDAVSVPIEFFIDPEPYRQKLRDRLATDKETAERVQRELRLKQFEKLKEEFENE